MTSTRRPPPFTLSFTIGIGAVLLGVDTLTTAWTLIVAAAIAIWLAIVFVHDDLAGYVGQWAVALASAAGGLFIAVAIATWLYS